MVSQSSPVSTPSQPNTNANQQPSSPKRIHLEPLIAQMQSVLQSKFPRYQNMVRDFLLGKNTRQEFNDAISQVLERRHYKLHNDIVLAIYTNAFHDPPTEPGVCNWGTKRRRSGPPCHRNENAKKLKTEVLSLPVRERQKLKTLLVNEHKGPAILPSSLIETRINKLPKVPYARDRFNTYCHDVKQGLFVPLLTEQQCLPEISGLSDRTHAIAIEHGLLDGIESGVSSYLLNSLEAHLKNIIQQTRIAQKSWENNGLENFSVSLALSGGTFVENIPSAIRYWNSGGCGHSESDNEDMDGITESREQRELWHVLDEVLA